LVSLCVRTDDDVHALLSGLLPSMKRGGIVANHGTGSPDICAELAASGAKYGVAVLDAPVSGGSAGAAAKTLTTMVAGDEPAAQAAQPVFEAFSRLVVYLGRAGSGQLAKLLNNLLFAVNLKSTEDILGIVESLGLDVDGFMRILLASSGASFAAEALSAHIPADRVNQYQQVLGKDLTHFATAGRTRGVPEQPVEDIARQGVDGIAAAVARLSAPGSLRAG
jgi:3-hydroxyisobutyrate dehydrogenase-like beta-hydroxyacid dehydrogenase